MHTSLNIVLDYILEHEEKDFREQLEDDDDLTKEEVSEVLVFMEDTNLAPSPEVLVILRRINHVYAHAVITADHYENKD